MMEKKIKSTEKFNGKIFKVTEDEVFVDKIGKTAKREIVHHHGGVGILARHENQILLVKQYRYAIGDYTWEIPAGKLEINEDPKACALREIEEETGYQALSMRLLTTVLATPGYCTEKLYIYYTDQLEKLAQPRLGDEDEDLIFAWFDIAECLEMIKHQEIVDAKTVIAILGIDRL